MRSPILLAGCGSPVAEEITLPAIRGSSALPLAVVPSMSYEIVLRYFLPDEGMVEVYEFKSAPGVLPRVASIRREPPTAADRDFVARLDEHGITPVDVDGEPVDG